MNLEMNFAEVKLKTGEVILGLANFTEYKKTRIYKF